jgi:phospholipid transport system substrate-binding protein
VRTEVKRDNGTPVPVNYSMRGTPQGWKAWDVTIEGVSYVKNFRTDFGSEIEAKGIDAVIQRLETQNAAAGKAPVEKAAPKAG